MKSKKQQWPLKFFIPAGLLIVTTTSLINRLVIHMPDFLTGTLMGAGIGLMIVSLLKYKRPDAAC